MSKSLIRLIDSSLLPAAIIILGKVVGLYLIAKAFDIPWTVENTPDALFSIRPTFDESNILIVSSYSDLLMFLLVLIGLSFSLFRAIFFHASHIDPKLVAKLATNNLLSLIKDSFGIYFEGSMWLVFSWIATFTIFINILLNKTFMWIGFLTLIVTLGFTVALLKDVVKEIELSRKRITVQNYSL